MRTLPEPRSEQPSFGVIAARTPKPSWPAQAEQILSAGLLAAKPRFEFRKSPGIVLHHLFHGSLHYLLWSPESSGYPSKAIMGKFGEFAWTGSVTLTNFLKSETGPRLQASLESLREIKPNQGFPIMTVSKFLHFYNPSLFPIYDEAVIWKKVFGRFEGEFRSFCVTTPGIVYNND